MSPENTHKRQVLRLRRGSGLRNQSRQIRHLKILVHEATERYQEERQQRYKIEAAYRQLSANLATLESLQEERLHTTQLRALGEVASGVAHDFNNLLTGILGTCQLLSLSETDPERKELLEVIELAALDGAETVRRIQEFARRRQPQRHTLIYLDEVVHGAIEITRPRWQALAQRQGIAITLSYEHGATLPVLGNAAELRELLINLILNAVDAMPQGGQLTVQTFEELARESGGHQASSYVGIIVSDTGIGMVPELQEQIFEPFFSTKESTKGSGIGLSVCRRIAQQHGGRIEVQSEPGNGTMFRLVLPAVLPTLEDEPTEGTALTQNAYRVLLIESDRRVAQVLQLMLEYAGHSVEFASSGSEALACFVPGRYDVVLVEQELPDLSGSDLVYQLRLHDRRFGAALLSCDEPNDLYPKPLDTTITLVKPIDRMTLLATVQRLAPGQIKEGQWDA